MTNFLLWWLFRSSCHNSLPILIWKVEQIELHCKRLVDFNFPISCWLTTVTDHPVILRHSLPRNVMKNEVSINFKSNSPEHYVFVHHPCNNLLWIEELVSKTTLVTTAPFPKPKTTVPPTSRIFFNKFEHMYLPYSPGHSLLMIE